MKRTNIFWFKKANIKKHNNHIFVLCCDKNGNVLKNMFPSVPEFWEQISDTTFYYSNVLTNTHGLEMGLNDKVKKFKKIIDPETFFKVFGKTNLERGKQSKSIFLYQNLEDAIYREEVFFEGLIWWFGNLEFLNDLNSFIDEIRICRCDVDFLELYPTEELDCFNFDEWCKTVGFAKTNSHETKLSKENRTIINSKQKQYRETEILDNGMVLVKSSKQIKNIKLPEIPVYQFEFYKPENQL